MLDKFINCTWHIYFHNSTFLNRMEFDNYIYRKSQTNQFSNQFSLFSYQQINFCKSDQCEFDFMTSVDFTNNVPIELVRSIFPESYLQINDISRAKSLIERLGLDL